MSASEALQAEAAKSVLSSQELYAQKWDHCANRALQYSVFPAAVGLLAMFGVPRIGKFLLFCGTSFGLGMAYAECAYSFKQPDMVHVTRLRKVSAAEPRP